MNVRHANMLQVANAEFLGVIINCIYFRLFPVVFRENITYINITWYTLTGQMSFSENCKGGMPIVYGSQKKLSIDKKSNFVPREICC